MRIVVFIAALAGLALWPTGPSHGQSAMAYLPADLDYATHCKPASAAVLPPLDRDWTTWIGEPITTSAEDLFAIAGEYLKGSDRVAQSRETAMKLLDYLAAERTISQPRIDRVIGKALIAEGSLAEGEKRLTAALDGGVTRAASDLAELYGSEGPLALRDDAKARTFLRIAAAAGDVDSQLGYARILSADPNVQAFEKTLAVDTAILGMIGRIAIGECRYMAVVGDLYLRGELVPQSVERAIAWYEQYAETGDARTEERLANLLMSRFVVTVDYDRAMAYLEDAAQKGRSSAALTVGIAYATGVARPQDPVAAERFLVLAAAAKSGEAEAWLARLYQGEFGGEPKPDLARQHFETAVALGADPELETRFGQFLAASDDPADTARALGIFERAAEAGSGQAAILAARLAAKGTLNDPALLAVARTYFRLGVVAGRPEGARQLARMAVCGNTVSPSTTEAAGWNERALYLGSTAALFEAAVRDLASDDATAHANGQRLMKQAAFMAMPMAIAYLVAHDESGRDGFTLDAAAAEQLLRFAAASPDPQFRLEVDLELVKARLALAESDAETAAQFARLDELVATGAPEAAMVKAMLISNDETVNPQVLADLYRLPADAGDKRAMRELALLLMDNPSTIVEGNEWLVRAADAGDLKATILLVDPSMPEAMPDLTAIAESGLVCTVDERVSLAQAFSRLLDPAGPLAAREWLASAEVLAGDDGDSLYKIADAYRDGVAGPDKVADAEALFNRAAEAGRPDALRDLAAGHMVGLWANSSPDEARTSLTQLAQSGDTQAIEMLLKAIATAQISASLDEVDTLLASSPFMGRTGETWMKLIRLDQAGAFGGAHPDRQAEWLQHAADSGNVDAMMNLYRAYAGGIGMTVDAATATQWLTRAAEGGDMEAASELAAAYDIGFGVPQDPVKAAYWRERAAFGAQSASFQIPTSSLDSIQ